METTTTDLNGIPNVKARCFTPQQKQDLLLGLETSGLSQRDFAAREKIGLSTLKGWLQQRRQGSPARVGKGHVELFPSAAGSNVSSPATAFLQVPNLLAQAPVARIYRVHLAGGIELEVGAGFRPEELATLLQLLRV